MVVTVTTNVRMEWKMYMTFFSGLKVTLQRNFSLLLWMLGYCSVLNFEIKHTVFLLENIVLSIMNPFIFIKILNQKKQYCKLTMLQ